MEKLKYLAAVLLGFTLIFVLIFVSYRVYKEDEDVKMYSMFSWNEENMAAEQKDEFITTIKKLDIGSVYQSVSQEDLGSKRMRSFIKDLSQESIHFYYLTGDPKWGLEGDAATFKAEINRIYEYNQTAAKEERIKGIVSDIEPYLAEEWDSADAEGKAEYFKNYVEGMILAYQYAKDKDLTILVCVPNFYDQNWYEDFERLAALGCDGLAVMNYDRENEIETIRDEIELARLYDKQVIFIAELQRPGEHELVENNTYYYEGLTALKEAFLRMGTYYDYEGLSYSYHYYEPVKELMGMER